MINISDDNLFYDEDLSFYEELCDRIHSIYLDVKYGTERTKSLYSLVGVMEELNELAGNKV